MTAADLIEQALAQRRRTRSTSELVDRAFSPLGRNTGNPDLDTFLAKIGGPRRSPKQTWEDWTGDLSAAHG